MKVQHFQPAPFGAAGVPSAQSTATGAIDTRHMELFLATITVRGASSVNALLRLEGSNDVPPNGASIGIADNKGNVWQPLADTWTPITQDTNVSGNATFAIGSNTLPAYVRVSYIVNSGTTGGTVVLGVNARGNL